MPRYQIHSHGPFTGPTVLQLLAALQPHHADLALLHSADNRGHSILAVDPIATVTDSLDALNTAITQTIFDDPKNLHIGWIGTITYDLARELEFIGNHALDDLHWPTLEWSLYDTYYIFDHEHKHWTIASLNHAPPALPPIHIAPDSASTARIIEQCKKSDYLAAVKKIQDYIAAGDIYQANFAQRWLIHTDASPLSIYTRLCAESPAEFAAFITRGNRAILSASPELFLHRRGNRLLTRPIKGTRPRDLTNPANDAALRTQLLDSEKDRAELNMIVDLLRNDLGRVSTIGSVHVTAPRTLEQLPTLWHTTAAIESTLAPNTTWPDILRALCPGGSITGAPKIRAMQIIEELEPTRRGVYCGNIGIICPDGNATLNIAIRTIQMQNDLAYVYAGGGVVADSDPEMEYEETLTKAYALFRALGVSLAL